MLGAASVYGGLAPTLFQPVEGDTLVCKSIAYLVKCRVGGFMVLVPSEPVLVDRLPTHEDVFGLQFCVITLEGKNKRTEDVDAVLLDISWDYVHLFSKWTQPRGEAGKAVLRFTMGDQAAKPQSQSVMTAAEAWIREEMDDDTAGDYVTGDEEPNLLLDPGGASANDIVDSNVVFQMQQRIQELEAKLQQPAAAVAAHAQPCALLGGQPSPDPSGAVLAKLKTLAGPGPGRLGAHERAQRAESPEAQLEGALQEEILGAAEEDAFQLVLAESLDQVQDPMQRLLVMQAQQLNLLSKQLHSKAMDPIQRAPAGSDSSSSSGAGMRGCLARDAFLKISQDLSRIAGVGEQQMLLDLGLHQATGLTPGLLQEYMEKRVPLGDHKLLTQMGYLMCSAYEIGSRSNNRELQGFAIKGMTFVDQAAIDGGRTQLAWLLTGLAEPNFQVEEKTETAPKPKRKPKEKGKGNAEKTDEKDAAQS